MKFEVNCDWGQNKSKQGLYKELPISLEQPLKSRQFQVLQKPNIRIFCYDCELDITRSVYVITKLQYFCIKCFANLQEYPQSFKKSFTNTSWDLLDEVVMVTAFQLWGFGNWSQIKQYFDYNGSPCSLKQIENYFETFYLNQPNNLPDCSTVYQVKPKKTFDSIAIEAFQSFYNSIDFKRKDSKGEKKITSMKSLPILTSSRQLIDPQKQNNLKLQCSQLQLNTQNQQISVRKEKMQLRNECSILGYNAKRKQFQLGQYDYYAQTMLSELQFYDNDTEQEFNLKIEIIQKYNKRLEERLKRRQFVVQYKLLDSHYHFNHQNNLDRQAIYYFQSFMRYTENHTEYKILVDDFSLSKKYEKYINNLIKIRERISKEGKIQDSYTYMAKKREKYIEKWQKTTNKIYHDKKRKVFLVNRDQDGNISVINRQSATEANQPFPFDVKQLFHLNLSQNETSIVGNVKVKGIVIEQTPKIKIKQQQIQVATI